MSKKSIDWIFWIASIMILLYWAYRFFITETIESYALLVVGITLSIFPKSMKGLKPKSKH